MLEAFDFSPHGLPDSHMGSGSGDTPDMASANVELAQRWIEMINERDAEALATLVHPDFELHNPWTPGGGVHQGIEAVAAFRDDFFDSWETYTVEEQQTIESGDTVVGLGHAHAEGATSGVTLDSPIAYVHTIRDGKLAHTQVFLDHTQALDAAGLA
jgi:ketosteroid isomerase-like protein